MTGPGVQVHCAAAIVLGSLVLVANNHGNGRAQGVAEFGPRLDLDAVLFVARRRQGALAGSPPGHLRLDVLLGQGHARRAAVDDAADGAAVRFAIARRR